jgi:hypothetical protein
MGGISAGKVAPAGMKAAFAGAFASEPGTALAAGTKMAAWQLGHLAFLPAYSSATRVDLPQWGQLNLIAIVGPFP